MQDFDKLDGILKDYKHFMSESPYIDKTLPSHVHLAGFAADGLQIHVHVRPINAIHACTPISLGHTCLHQFKTPCLRSTGHPNMVVV